MICPHCLATVGDDARFCPACGKAASPTETRSDRQPPAATDMIGKEIAGRYRILAKLGEGGMGAVYRGEQISLKRAVAVKLLKPELSGNSMLLRRFNAEAEAVAKLSHPNTVNIYDFGQDTDGALFIAMEYIEGRSLRSAIGREGPFSPARALHIATQVAASLADAHGHAIVHRDLKPDNVMLQDRGRHRDVARVLDFGIAKLRDDSRATQVAMTQAGDMLGTPSYMAPEQIRGDTIDGRTDIYALGCMLYEMITARMPYEAPTVMAMLSKHLLEPLVPPSQRRPELGLPAALDAIVLAAMAKDPAARPPTMEQYGEQLAALLATLPPDANRSAATPLSAVLPNVAPPPVTPLAPSAYHSPTPPPAAVAVPAPSHFPPSQLATLQVGVKRRSRAPYAVLGVVLVAGAGIGVWAATRSGSAPSKPDPWSTPSSPTSTDPGSGSESVEMLPEMPAHPNTPDLWAGSSAPGLPAAEALPPGANILAPPGFERKDDPTGQILIDRQHGVVIALGVLDRTSDDPDVLARLWAQRTDVRYDKRSTIFSHGQDRDLVQFSGTNAAGPFRQEIIAYISSTYRLGVLVGAPLAVVETKEFEPWVRQFLVHNLRLPR